MNKFVYISWTCRNLEEARKIAGELLQKKLVGCVNIIPHVESIYLWKGKIETSQEVKVFLKTIDRNYTLVKDYIEQTGSYEVPEVAKILLDEINPSYQKWLNEIFT